MEVNMEPIIEEREFVYVPKSLAKKIKELEDGKVKEDLILEYLDKSRKEVKANLETLEDDVIQYQGIMIKAKQTFEKAKNEQLTASYDLWERFDKEMPKLQKKIETITSQIEPIANQIIELNEALDKIHSYQIKDLVELLKEVSSCLEYDGNTGKILKFLVTNYNKKDNN